jgi:hypothetical protein
MIMKYVSQSSFNILHAMSYVHIQHFDVKYNIIIHDVSHLNIIFHERLSTVILSMWINDFLFKNDFDSKYID